MSGPVAQREVMDLVVHHPTEAVHIDTVSGRLDTIVFSSILACMRHAFDRKEIASQGDMFFVKREDFRRYVGRDESNNDDDIIDSCNRMLDLKIQWNTLSKGRVKFGGRLNLLSTFSLTERAGYFGFRANPDLSRLVNLLKPQLYGRYRLLQIQALKATYSRKLFWFVMEDLGRSHGEREPDTHVTEPCKVAWLKEYLGLTKFPRYTEFKFLRSEVLNPALADISHQSGYVVDLMVHRIGRTIDAVSFKLSRNAQLPLALASTTDERGVLLADLQQLGITAALGAKWLEMFPLHDVQLVWSYVKGMHQKEPKANLAGYMTACLRNSGLVTNLTQKARRQAAHGDIGPLRDEMRRLRERCSADLTAARRDGWLGLTDDERASLWHSLPSVQLRRIPTWCQLGIQVASLTGFLLDDKFVAELCNPDRPVEILFSELKEAMASRHGAVWPKLEGLLAANGYDALKARVAELEAATA